MTPDLTTGPRDSHGAGAGRLPSIVASLSRHGVVWGDWKSIHTHNPLHNYPSIVPADADNKTPGKAFSVYGVYSCDSVLPEIDWARNRWDRVLLTLE